MAGGADYSKRHAEGAGLTPASFGASSWTDHEALRAWQKAHGLTADGIVGPQTVAAYRAEKTPASPKHPPFGLTGVLTSQHRRKRTTTPHAIVLHDTVSHTAKSAQNTLDDSGYGTHFLIEHDGRVLQTADPATDEVSHCGGFNDDSIGIDVVAILDPSLANAGELVRTIKRPWSASKRKGKVIDYTPEQKTALVKLVRALCDAFGIPHYVLDAQVGYGAKVPGLSPAFRGVLAHAQWSSKRWDGLLAVEALIADGYEHDGGALK